MSSVTVTEIHGIIKTIFKRHLGKKKVGPLDNPLNCPYCNQIATLTRYDFYDNELMFYCNFCYGEFIYEDILKFYNSDLETIQTIISNINSNRSLSINFKKKILYDFITSSFENCIKIDFDIFCNKYYNSLTKINYSDEVTL